MNGEIHCQQCDHDIDDHAYGKICRLCLWDDRADTCTESPSSIVLDYTSRILNNAPPTTSDGYHTFEELYEYRTLYNAMAANLMPHLSSKSWRHSDGEYCFGGGWFVVTMNLPEGRVTNHYQEQYWDLFQIQHLELAPPWDGHTPEQAADRLKSQCLNTTAIEPNPCACKILDRTQRTTTRVPIQHTPPLYTEHRGGVSIYPHTTNNQTTDIQY